MLHPPLFADTNAINLSSRPGVPLRVSVREQCVSTPISSAEFHLVRPVLLLPHVGQPEPVRRLHWNSRSAPEQPCIGALVSDPRAVTFETALVLTLVKAKGAWFAVITASSLHISLAPAVWRKTAWPTSPGIANSDAPRSSVDWNTPASLGIWVEIDPTRIPCESWQTLLAVAAHSVIHF